MENNFTNNVQKSAKTTSLVREAPEGQLVPAEDLFERLNLTSLGKLEQSLKRTPTPARRLPKPLSPEDLEMLEAELSNQGILTRSNPLLPALSHYVYHEMDVWKWRAQRFGSNANQLEFLIDVPRYVVARAHELLAQAENTGSNSIASMEAMGALSAELQYLDRFAAYLCGVFDTAQNRYERGLNVVLRALATRSQSLEITQAKQISLVLPLSRSAFFRALKDCRASR